MQNIIIGNRIISQDSPSYFIADIASNHCGDLYLAKDLIFLAKEAGADAVKFQHFLADEIVSDAGFRALGAQLSHQSGWKESVYDVFKRYELDRDWTDTLIETAKKVGIEFFTTPYDREAVEILDRFLPAYKIGSGDITWIEFIEFIAAKDKPVLLATGASSMEDVTRAVEALKKSSNKIILMQCNTNYTASLENFRYLNLSVLNTYKNLWPDLILGLSDHTLGHASVLGAISFGARVFEKHFTDDVNREGPDHAFSMTPTTWKEMVERSQELESALGDGIKRIEENERDTVIAQRRCIRVKMDLASGTRLTRDNIDFLRPAPPNAIQPYEVDRIIGRLLSREKSKGEHLCWKDLRDDD